MPLLLSCTATHSSASSQSNWRCRRSSGMRMRGGRTGLGWGGWVRILRWGMGRGGAFEYIVRNCCSSMTHLHSLCAICTALMLCALPWCYMHCLDAMCTALMLCALPYAMHMASCYVHCLLLCSQPLAMLLLVYIPVACSLKSPVYSLWTSGKYFCSIYRLIQFTHFGLQTSLCMPVLTGIAKHCLCQGISIQGNASRDPSE